MLEKLKNLSIISKILYLLAFLLFIAGVLPQMNSYYTNVNNYESNKQEIQTLSQKYGLSNPTEAFSKEVFKNNTEALFSKVDIEDNNDNSYTIHISIEKDKLKSFHTFIESLALRYYVKIKDGLDFSSKDDNVNVSFTLETL